MKKLREQGNASIGIIIGSALAGLLYLQSVQKNVASQFNITRNAKLRTETNEAALYALSLASQLLKNDPATGQPRVAADNIVDPPINQRLKLQSLVPVPTGVPVRIDSLGAIQVAAPVGGKAISSDLNQLFSDQDFGAFETRQEGSGTRTSVRVQASGYEPFDTGYGMKQMVLDAAVQISDGTLRKDQLVRALVELPVPKGTCVLEVFADGVKQADGASVTQDKPVTANLSCQGVIYSGEINVNGASVLVGPLTAAKTFTSVVPSLFPTPVAISGAGRKDITASYQLIDGTRYDLPPFTLYVTAPPTADITKCLDKCMLCGSGVTPYDNCHEDWEKNPYRKPFPKDLSGILPWPTVTKVLNGYEDDAERTMLRAWATSKGIWEWAAVFLSFSYPRYGEVLVCQNTVTWEPTGFDPANNCQETPVAGRGYVGCLDPESLITVRPGVAVPIKRLRAGHTVYNPITHETVSIRRVVKGPERKAMNRIVAGEQELILTANHPVMTEKGERLAADVTARDRVLVADQWHLVTENVSFLPGADQEVWNIELAGDDEMTAHWLEANGMVVGDLWMQERLNQ